MLDRKDVPVHKRAIAELLHGKIVPDLVQSLSINKANGSSPMDNASSLEFRQSDIIALSRHLVDGNSAAAQQLVSGYLDADYSAASVVLGLFAMSARHLGDQWCSDEASFADVTLGMFGLHKLMRGLDDLIRAELTSNGRGKSILLTAMPGDTHIFAVSMLEMFFRNSGWSVEAVLDADERGIMERIGQSRFAVIGVSVGCRQDLSKAKAMVRKLRTNSLNEGIKILVGGAAFRGDAGLVREIGADAYADNPLQAIDTACGICASEAFADDGKNYV